MVTKRLYKSPDKMLSGVCSGIAEYFDIDPTLVRLLWVAASLCTAILTGLIIYVIFALVMPEKHEALKGERVRVKKSKK